jgi:hypothetical protein
MDSEKRIQDLEKQVKELAETVRRLLAEREGETGPAVPGPARPAKEPRPSRKQKPRRVLPPDVRKNVDKVLGGEAGETLETRIGGIWLSRVAAVIVMTTIALGARETIYSEVLGPWEKLAIVYGVGAVAIVYGLIRYRSPNYFPQTILGTGLAGVYFATYAAFFVQGMAVFPTRAAAVPALLVCLLLIVVVAHGRRSQTVAGISLFLVYYTVVVSCMGGKAAENIQYALVTCAMLAVVALAFHAAHRWLLFTWAALIATYLTYVFYFLAKPAGLEMADGEYFWLSNGFLTLCYVVFSLACIIDARKTGEYRRGVAQMSGVNSFIYLVLVWIAIRQHYVEFEWAFRLGIAAGLLLLAVLANVTGPRRNYLFQIFVAKAVIMLTLALQAYFSGEKLMVAMALECLGLAFSYKRSGIVMFKVMEMALLLITFAGCLVHVKTAGGIPLGAFLLRSNWFCCAGSAVALVAVAWFYERFVWRIRPEHRVVKSQWFLADTFLDVSSTTAALLHAAAAALILLTITIIDRGSDPLLPYYLAGEGVLMGLAGFLLGTPQVEVGGVLLLVASHVCYHAFLSLGRPGFEQQPNYALYTVFVALFTYVGAYLWEGYLRRIKGGKPWEHHAVAALPYLAATLMLVRLIGRELEGMHAPLAQNVLGVMVLMVGVLTRYTGVKASGLLALAFGGGALFGRLYVLHEPYAEQPGFLFFLIFVLATYVAAERIFVVFQHQERVPSKAEDVFRFVLIGAAAALGILGANRYGPAQYRTLYWLALAVAAVVLGAVFRESRYRWIALILFGAAIVRAFAFDLRKLAPLYQFLSFAAMSVPLLIVSWAYSRYRQKELSKAARLSQEDTPAHG